MSSIPPPRAAPPPRVRAILPDADAYCENLVAWAAALNVPPIAVAIAPPARPGFAALLESWRSPAGTTLISGQTNRAVIQHVLASPPPVG